MAKVKICGLKRYEDIDMANELRPDYVGFVFAKGSKRAVDYFYAQELKSVLDERISAVGVFVNNDIGEIVHLLNKKVIDIAQLHGDETEGDIIHIKKITKKPVIKAVSVKTIDDILKYKDSNADFLLFDNGRGGTGETFNWSALDRLKDFKKPFFFAGGLNASNIKKAIEYQPFAVDVSGGVEIDGFKDFDKVKEFIDLVRR
ncbi:MAG: phosphoribosylanthranilate isomerase [Clostridia bacterium]